MRVPRVASSLVLPVLLLTLPFTTADTSDSHNLQAVVADANRLLSSAQYAEAARAYSQAIDLDPTSYLNYYKRATAYLSLGRHGPALDDFERILELNPNFSQAHWQKAKILAREGDFDAAESSLAASGKGKGDAEAKELSDGLRAARDAQSAAVRAEKHGQWDKCVEDSSRALEVASNSVALRELRLRCNEEIADVMAVYGDLRALATLNPSSIPLALRLSHISYFLLASSSALKDIKQCLHYDPDSKPCKKAHKLLRSLDKDTQKARNFVEGSQWRQALKVLDGNDGLLARFEQALEDAQQSHDGYPPFIPPKLKSKETSHMRLDLLSMACKAAVGADVGKKAGKWCEDVLSLDPENIDGLVGRGERLLKEEMWDEATRTFEAAFEKSGRSSQDILNRLQKAQRLLKVSKQKDYYKVLGVPRDADDRTIKKAFRKAAKIAHPDVGGTEEKMAALNEAYEVLIDPELRQRYDNGDDPNDPTSGQHQNPFAHHGGAPFQFFQQGGGGGGFAQQGFQFHFGQGGGPKMPQWG